MRKEFLLSCEEKIVESYVHAANGRLDQNYETIKEVSNDIAREVANSVAPVSRRTTPYVVAALRFFADSLEKDLDAIDKMETDLIKELLERTVKFEKQVESFNRNEG